MEEELAKKRKSSGKRSKKRKLTIPTIVVIAVAAIVIIAINFHFMLTKDGPKVIKKVRWGAADTFVDTRDWGPLDWITHTDVLKATGNDMFDHLQEDIIE